MATCMMPDLDQNSLITFKGYLYRSNPFRSTLNTGYITGLDMCTVCTEAVHSVALEHGLHYRFGHV